MSKVTAFSPYGKSLAEMTALPGINGFSAQYFTSCGKRREMLCASYSHTDGRTATCTGLGIR